MPIRNRRTFSVGETSSPINPSLKATLKALIVRMDEINRRLQEFKDQAKANCKDLAARLIS